MNDQDIEQMVNRLAILETQVMLKTLAVHLGESTRVQFVPDGTKTWQLDNGKIFGIEEDKQGLVKLIKFFGVFIGYNQKYNVLVCWQSFGREIPYILTPETSYLLNQLAANFSENTKYQEVATNQYNFIVNILKPQKIDWTEKPDEEVRYETKAIPFIRFFGLHVAYEPETDIMGFWR